MSEETDDNNNDNNMLWLPAEHPSWDGMLSVTAEDMISEDMISDDSNNHYNLPFIVWIADEISEQSRSNPEIVRATVTEEYGFAYVKEEEVEEDTEALREREEKSMENVIKRGICAKTSDFKDQDIQHTLDNSTSTFWSSVGYELPEMEEYLIYELKGPLSIVHQVTLKVHRAVIQPDAPIYPPQEVQFGVGNGPKSMTFTDKLRVYRSSQEQVFNLKAMGYSMAGPFLVIIMHGALQKQTYDAKYYLTLESVQAHGEPCDSSEKLALLKERFVLRSNDSRQLARFLSVER